MIMNILTDLGTMEIGGIASGGSIFLALVSLVIKMIIKRIQREKRYKAMKEGLEMINRNLEEKNPGGQEKTRTTIDNIIKSLEEIKNLV